MGKERDYLSETGVNVREKPKEDEVYYKDRRMIKSKRVEKGSDCAD